MADSHEYYAGLPASTETSPNADSPADPSPAATNMSAPGSAPPPQQQQPARSLAEAPPPPGASVYPPAAAVSASLNPRSCVTCRRRKVRCDKHMPCGNCRRAHIQCVFPAPGRAPRRPRPRDPNAPPKQSSSDRELELMKRLRKLEGVVEELSGQIELEAVRNTSSSGNSPEANVLGRDAEAHHHPSSVAGRVDAPAGEGGGPYKSSPLDGKTCLERANSLPPRPSTGAGSSQASSSKSKPPFEKRTSEVSSRLGRLVLGQKGTSRYVSSGFWSKITDELDEIRAETQNITEEDSEESDMESTPASVGQDPASSSHRSFLFGYRSSDVDLKPLHPLPSQIPFIWQVYQDNVEPLIRVLHVPTMDKMIRDICVSLDKLTPPTEALMFAIYYAAVTSLDEDEVKVTFGVERNFLLSQYRFALEQALTKADFLTELNFTTSQAFLIFLVIVRHHDQSRFTWSMTALIVRTSQAMGLHRDGSNFPSLSPFEVEMRRRLFWAICVLDIRSSEDLGTDLTLTERDFDTQLPLNVNDTDLDPDSTVAPTPREGHSDMTFSLVRYDITLLARQLHNHSANEASLCPDAPRGSIERREALLAEAQKRFNKYLQYGHPSESVKFWVATNVARLIMAKMTLLIYQPVLFPGPGNEYLSRDCRERLFMAAVEIFEYNHILNTDPRAKRWRWLFRTYTQWHAVAYVLLEMPHRPWCATVERAWGGLLSSIFGLMKPSEVEKMAEKAAVWLPLRSLYHKAKKYRESEIERLRSDPAAAQELDRQSRNDSPPDTFGALPGSVRSAIARERWRKLVNMPTPPPDDKLPAKVAVDSRSPDPGPSEGRSTTTTTTSFGSQQQKQQQQRPDPQTRETELMDHFMGDTMNSRFLPAELFPLAWSAAESMDTSGYEALGGAGNNAVHGGGTTFVPDNLGGTSALRGPGYTIDPQQEHNSQSQHQQQQQQHQHHHQQQHQQQQRLPRFGEQQPRVDELPPWLWPASGPISPPAEDFPIDDLDVTMDEGFNWQTWQENVRGFEAETTGGAGLWGFR